MSIEKDMTEATRRAMDDGNNVQYHLDAIRRERDDKYKTSNGHFKHDGSHRFTDTGGSKEGDRFDDSDLIAAGWTATIYPYKLPDGTLLYQQNRYDPKLRPNVDAPNKRYIPTRPSYDGKYQIVGPGERRVIYNWSAIIRAGPGSTVFVTEGEKNADDLIKRGLLATTVISHKWDDECIAALTGYDLIILADHDEDGERDALKARRLLSKVAKTIRLVPCPHLWKHLAPEHSSKPPFHNADVSDWLAYGGNADKLTDICRELPVEGEIVADQHKFPDEATLPVWDFLYGRHLLRNTVSATAAMGATGKSSMSIAEALAMVTGRPLLRVSSLFHKVEPLRVLLINLEDNREAVDKRIAAAMKHYKLTPEDIDGRLFTIAKGELRFKIAAQARSGMVEPNEPAIRGMTAFLLEKKIDVLSIDPFIATHSVVENDNTAIRNVIECYDLIAEGANCAVSIWHHTRKANGQEASIDSARGAGAFADACRSVRVLETMSKTEAKELGLQYAGSYFRSFSGKLNFAPPSEQSDWYHFVSVRLNNGPVFEGTSFLGDEVGVVEAWDHPLKGGKAVDLSIEQISEIQRVIASSDEWREDVRADMWAGKAIASALNIDVGETKRLKSILSKLIFTGQLKRVTRKDKKREDRVYVECIF
jgi:hypothetical protein